MGYDSENGTRFDLEELDGEQHTDERAGDDNLHDNEDVTLARDRV